MFENKYLIPGILLMVVVAVSGCTSQNQTSQNQTPAANTVNIQNTAFNPPTMTVPVGTTVKWINMDSTTHNVISDNGVFESGELTNGQSFSYTFNQEGTFAYHCSIHTNMHGTIIVSSSTTPTTTTNSQSSGSSGSSHSSSSGNTNTGIGY